MNRHSQAFLQQCLNHGFVRMSRATADICPYQVVTLEPVTLPVDAADLFGNYYRCVTVIVTPILIVSYESAEQYEAFEQLCQNEVPAPRQQNSASDIRAKY